MKKIYNVVIFLLFGAYIHAQSIDKVKAVIGSEIILTSEIESQYVQYLSQNNEDSDKIKCDIIEDLLFQKLLINHAKIDSLFVSEDEIYTEIEKRLNYFQSQLGSLEKVEEYFGKSEVEIKLDLNKVIKEQFLAQKLQNSITSDVNVTPAEVREFFNAQDVSEIPEVPAKVELTQIIIKPVITETQKDNLRNKLISFRERVYDGEDFKMLATLYSDDPASASKGGELGYVNRGDLVPEFERAAFRLNEGEISEVVESQFGFHIVQLIKRRGDQINVRHILLKTKISSTSLFNTKNKIQEIDNEINSEIISFEQAISKYSDDESKNNSGLLLNPNTMSTMHTINDMSPALKYIVKNLKINETSVPSIIQMPDGTQAYRILKLTKKVDSHTANLIDDFSLIKDFSLNIKKQDALLAWVQKKINLTHIKINESMLDCEFKNKWIK
jgi:peptidyl-prolyl cis-trans isomerase SurA